MTKYDITVYRGLPATKIFTSSPFVTKLELRLRLDNVKHQIDVGASYKAPRSKIPYVRLAREADEATVLGDSSLIISKLIDDGVLENLNNDLSPIQKVQDLSLRALVEERLYWFHVSIFDQDGHHACVTQSTLNHWAVLRDVDAELLHHAILDLLEHAISRRGGRRLGRLALCGASSSWPRYRPLYSRRGPRLSRRDLEKHRSHAQRTEERRCGREAILGTGWRAPF